MSPQDFDFSGDPQEPRQLGRGNSGVPLEEKPYDSRPHEDSARRIIAYALLGILGFVIVWALVTVTFKAPKEQAEKAVTAVLQIVLSPIIALVSAATGFYYGSKTATSNNTTKK